MLICLLSYFLPFGCSWGGCVACTPCLLLRGPLPRPCIGCTSCLGLSLVAPATMLFLLSSSIPPWSPPRDSGGSVKSRPPNLCARVGHLLRLVPPTSRLVRVVEVSGAMAPVTNLLLLELSVGVLHESNCCASLDSTSPLVVPCSRCKEGVEGWGKTYWWSCSSVRPPCQWYKRLRGMGTGALRFRPTGGLGRGMVFSASHLALHMSESPVTAVRTPALRVLSSWASVRFIGCSPVRASVAKTEPPTPKISGTVHTVFTVRADDCHPPNARWARQMPCSASRYCVPLAARAAAIVSGASIALVNSRMRTVLEEGSQATASGRRFCCTAAS